MKRLTTAILLPLAALLVLAAPALAQELGSQTTSSAPTLDTIGTLGKGIASLPSDPTNFKILKIGVAKFRVSVNGTDTIVPIGVLVLDDQNYRIRNVVMGNGSVTGDIYLNGTQVGSISLESVMKGDMEVWAGTLSVDGTTYNAYVLEAPRAIKTPELKQKISDYCNESGNCSQGIESYCQSNPTDTRCLALFKAFCVRSNNTDARCRDFMQGWCKDNPEVQDCRLLAIDLSAKYCADNPTKPVCNALTQKLVDYCSTDPGNEKCNQTCQQHPQVCKSIVKNLAEFCLDNANSTDCTQYCTDHPKACVKVAANVITGCIQDPNSTDCKDFCTEHPAACKLVTAELASFCITNSNNTRCQSYCDNHPDSCTKVTQNIEGFCSTNSGKALCKGYCKMFPDKCASPQPVDAVVDNSSRPPRMPSLFGRRPVGINNSGEGPQV